MLLKLTLAYDGTGFRGWARQPGERTVEGVLAAGARLRLSTRSARWQSPDVPTPASTRWRTSSRSRSGAARPLSGPRGRSTRSFPPTSPSRGLNGAGRVPRPLLGPLALLLLPDLAPSRCGLRSRLHRALWYPAPDRPRAAGGVRRRRSCGEHDFRAFTPTDTQHQVFVRRILAAGWRDRGAALEFEITADSFLRHMVRTLVGTMLERSPTRSPRLLDGAPRCAAGPTAPAYGLYLVEVGYGLEAGDGNAAVGLAPPAG